MADKNLYHGGSWPNQAQELLLRAALLHGNEALVAWESWSVSIDFDRIDHASARLLPLLYKNLSAQGVEAPLMNRMKGVYRLTWAKNQVLFRSMAPILAELHKAGLDTVVLKGAALIVQYYHEYGLRPIGDFDVLAHASQASAAIKVLRKLGLKVKKEMEALSDESLLSISHGRAFMTPEGHMLDLHWRVLHDSCCPDDSDDFWAGAVPIVIGDVPTKALNPADSLLHLCIHGSLWSAVAPIRWVADAMMILNSAEAQVDWSRLVAQTRQRQLVLTVREALSYLRRLLDAPIPAEVLQTLKDVPVSRAERLEYRIRLRSHMRLIDRLVFLVVRYRRYLRLSVSGRSAGRRLSFVGFLKIVWGVDSAWKVPYYVAAKLVRRLAALVLNL